MNASDSTNSGELEIVAITGKKEFASAALDVISSARLQLSLMSVSLEKDVFGTQSFVSPLRDFILEHRRAKLRVLLHDPKNAVRNCIRLVELGRALSSRIEFRQVSDEGRKLQEEYFIADECTVLHRNAPDALEARFYPNAPMVARSQLKAFETIWQESAVAREMSALGI